MGHDVIGDLIGALNRLGDLDDGLIKDVLIISGMPAEGDNLRYVGYNRQIIASEHGVTAFSAVAVINNRRADKFRLTGYPEKLSRIVFNTRWTRNPLDLYLNNLRCDPSMMDILAAAPADFTLLGIVQEDRTEGKGLFTRTTRRIRPMVAVPGIPPEALNTVIAFETGNAIQKGRVRGGRFAQKSRPHSHGY